MDETAIIFQGFNCKIAEDSMSVAIVIEPPTDNRLYMVEEVVEYLRKSGVTSGFLYSEIENMVRNEVYGQSIVVARGIEPVDGKDGYYEYYFDTEKLKHPAIRPDGSVDYQSMNVVKSVQNGDVLAVYHGAVAGRHGIDVRGRELRCKPAKELQPIKGAGFEVDEDGITYRATQDGRVDYNNFKLYIRDIYEVRGDFDLLTGKLDFRGDIIIHGSVRAGTFIRASKSITVEGNVESAVIIAEGDIVLKKGMQGGSKARLVSGGSIYAYFLEYTDVSAKGDIEANIILNCKVSAGGNITVKGKKGLIVGGKYTAVSTIASTNIGNPAQVRTVCTTGLTSEIAQRNHVLMTKKESLGKSINALKRELIECTDSRISTEPKEVRQAKADRIKKKIRCNERAIEHLDKDIEEMRLMMDAARNARVIVNGTVYEGVVIRIDDREKQVETKDAQIMFVRPTNRDDIETRSLV